MAEGKVMINGVLWDKLTKTGRNVALIGDVLMVPDGPEKPPLPGGPHPEHPIMLPGMPGWGDPHPEHPIVIPPPPIDPPDPPLQPGGIKPPPPGGGWGYHPDYGWGYFPGTGGAGPKTPPAAGGKK